MGTSLVEKFELSEFSKSNSKVCCFHPGQPSGRRRKMKHSSCNGGGYQNLLSQTQRLVVVTQVTPREEKKSEQIARTKGLISTDRGTRPLSCVQYPVLHLSHIQRICLSRYLELFFSIRRSPFCGKPSAVTMLWSWPEGYTYSFRIKKATYRRFPAWILA